jgi:hypothetical protein
VVGFGVDEFLRGALLEGKVEEFRWNQLAVQSLRFSVPNPAFSTFQPCGFQTMQFVKKFNADSLLSAVFLI